ncbi:MAG: O-antigen ligase family protein [Bacteroidota bacterium]
MAKKNYSIIIQNLFFAELILLSFLLPINHAAFTIILIPTVITSILHYISNGSIEFSINKRWVFLFILPYLASFIGFLYSSNKPVALFDLEVKLSILLFPLILFCLPKAENKLKLNSLSAYIIGCFVAVSICFVYATYWFYNVQQDIYCFYYTRFSILFHPTYFSMYLNLAIAILVLKMINGYLNISGLTKLILWGIIAYFVSAIVLLSSKTGIITLLLILISAIAYIVIARKKYFLALKISTVFIIALIIFFQMVPFSTLRIKTAITEFISTKSKGENIENSPSSTRLATWKSSLEIINENFIFGTGNGDAKEHLIEKYKERKAYSAAELKLNAHNQFLQTFVELGLFGFSIFILCLIIPMYFAYKTNNIVYLIFILIFSINILTESMFNTRSGVLFYGFMNSLLFFQGNFNKKNEIIK